MDRGMEEKEIAEDWNQRQLAINWSISDARAFGITKSRYG